MVNKNKKRVIGVSCAVLAAAILLGAGLTVFRQGQKESPDTSKEDTSKEDISKKTISAEAELQEEKEDTGDTISFTADQPRDSGSADGTVNTGDSGSADNGAVSSSYNDTDNRGNAGQYDGTDNLDNTASVHNSDNADADPADNDVSFDTVRKEDSSSMTVTDTTDVTITSNGSDVKAEPSSTQSQSPTPAASSDPEWSNDY